MFSQGVLLQKVEDMSSALDLYSLGVSHAFRAQGWYVLHLGLNTY